MCFNFPLNLQSELVAELFQQDSAGGAVKLSVPNGSLRSGKRAQREHKLTVGFQVTPAAKIQLHKQSRTPLQKRLNISPDKIKDK